MNDKKDSYLKRYLKENLVVLLFELVIVVLLACICSLMLGGEPVWLAPALAVFAYLMAELRFMMSYMASCAREAREERKESAPEEKPLQEADEQESVAAMQEDALLEMSEDLEEDLDNDFDEEAPFIPPIIKYSEEAFDESFFDEPMEEEVLSTAEEDVEEALAEQDFAQPTWEGSLETVELSADLFEEPDEEDLLEADIDLLDESLKNEDPLQDDEIYNIFKPPVRQDGAPLKFDIPVQGVLDLGDDEDPFSH